MEIKAVDVGPLNIIHARVLLRDLSSYASRDRSPSAWTAGIRVQPRKVFRKSFCWKWLILVEDHVKYEMTQKGER